MVHHLITASHSIISNDFIVVQLGGQKFDTLNTTVAARQYVTMLHNGFTTLNTTVVVILTTETFH